MQTIDFKKGDPSNTRNFASAISRFIETGYHRDTKDFEADFRRLEEMRGEVMAPMVTPSFLVKFRRYPLPSCWVLLLNIVGIMES